MNVDIKARCLGELRKAPDEVTEVAVALGLQIQQTGDKSAGARGALQNKCLFTSICLTVSDGSGMCRLEAQVRHQLAEGARLFTQKGQHLRRCVRSEPLDPAES